MVFNQNFVLSWNTIWANLSRRIGEDLILQAEYTSPFSEFVRQLELGNYVQESYINPAKIYLHDTVINSDILTDHTDTILTTIHEVNVDLNIPSTYKEYVARTSFSFWENVNNLIASLVANLRVTSEIAKNNIVKQMLYNAWSYGMLDTTVVNDPRTSDANSAQYIIALNTLVDDILVEANTRNMIYNNQEGIGTKAVGIGTSIPYVIMFNEFLRSAEVLTALQLVFGKYNDTSGNNNQDYTRRLIRLNYKDFPTGIPSTNRSAVTGSNVPYDNVNFFEPPMDADGEPIFAGEPKAGEHPIGFVLEPEALLLRSQLDVQTNFTNPATLATTNRLILRMIVSLSGFNKIACIAMD